MRPITIKQSGERRLTVKKEKGGEMKALRQERFPSGNPDLVETTAIPRCDEYDLRGYGSRWDGEFNAKVVKPGNCVRKDGKE
jgi:hypothetical protein